MKSNLMNKIIPVAIILLGIIIMIALVKGRPSPKKMSKASIGQLVETTIATLSDFTATVEGTSSITSDKNVDLMPRVSGNVNFTAEAFENGGFFNKGEVLFRIDRSDYELQHKQALATMAKAEYELATIKSNASIARTEWKIMTRGDNNGESKPSPLALYEPQLKNAEAVFLSAEASVAAAQLNLERTTLRAPFDCRVKNKTIDTGQYVMAGKIVASLSSTAKAEAVVKLKQDELKWIKIPGSKVIIKNPALNLSDYKWKGKVIRTVGEIDEKSRTVEVVIEILDPYKLKSKSGKQLLEGSFVTASIKGKKYKDVFVLPRQALRDKNTVWIIREGSLVISKVNILRIEEDNVIITHGDDLEPEDSIILTKINGATQGMLLRQSTGSNF